MNKTLKTHQKWTQTQTHVFIASQPPSEPIEFEWHV